jgi:CTP:phosphocholine cytidylyltransferase-like protein
MIQNFGVKSGKCKAHSICNGFFKTTEKARILINVAILVERKITQMEQKNIQT